MNIKSIATKLAKKAYDKCKENAMTILNCVNISYETRRIKLRNCQMSLRQIMFGLKALVEVFDIDEYFEFLDYTNALCFMFTDEFEKYISE